MKAREVIAKALLEPGTKIVYNGTVAWVEKTSWYGKPLEGNKPTIRLEEGQTPIPSESWQIYKEPSSYITETRYSYFLNSGKMIFKTPFYRSEEELKEFYPDWPMVDYEERTFMIKKKES